MLGRIKNWIKTVFLSKYLGSFVRTLLAVLAGYLVSQGIIPDAAIVESLAENLTEILSGIILYLLAQGSSLVQKKIDK